MIWILSSCAPSVRYTRGGDSAVRKPRFSLPEGTETSALHTKLENTVASYLGVPYKYGGTSGNGIDCSGFVFLVFKEVYNVELPRSSGKMWKLGKIVSPNLARPGDLIFFRGGFLNRVNHVGIYMGNDRFVHASGTNGVIYSDINDDYYSRHFAAIRRIF